MKIEFDNLGRLFVAGCEFPFLDRVLASLHEERMTADYAGAFDATIRRNDDFDLDLADYVHPLGQIRIDRSDAGFHLALPFLRRARLSKTKSSHEHGNCCGSHKLPCPIASAPP